MGYRQKANLGCNWSLLAVASIIIVANCSLIRVTAYRSVLPAHQANQYGAADPAANDSNHNSISLTHISNPWWRRNDRFTSIEDRGQPTARRDEPSSMEDGFGTVVRRNTGRSVYRRLRDTCGLAPRNPITADRIWNGKTQKYGEWPSYVHIRTFPTDPRFENSWCGGTLVSDRHVLTAAHCVIRHKDGVSLRLEPSEVLIDHAVHSMVGPSEYKKSSRANSICIARGYDPAWFPLEDDWALIEFDEPVEFSDYIQPACLPEESIQTEGETSECWVVGVGKTHTNKVHADYVQKLRVKRMSCDELKLIAFDFLDDKHACYANHDVPAGNICPGDSGGPVLCLDNQNRWTVVAVASMASRCIDKFPYNRTLPLGGIYTNMEGLLKDVKAQCHI